MNLTKLGRFEIIREIGKGAMGQVFLANDPKIERKVAIKTIVLPPGTSEEEAHETSQRFLREARPPASSCIRTSSRFSTWAKRGASPSSRWSTSKGRPWRNTPDPSRS